MEERQAPLRKDSQRENERDKALICQMWRMDNMCGVSGEGMCGALLVVP
jgi:hypothetical protein